MPTTRKKAADDGSDILHGLVEEKRVRKSGSSGSSGVPKPGSKKGAKKSKGKLDPNLPHIAVANLLYERGNNTEFPEQPPQVQSEQQEEIIWETGETPITDPSRLPEGWSANEPDLDPEDIDGQIARCQKRIADGIMPQLFENRLETFSQIKEQQMALVKSEPDGLSWEVVHRLDCLKQIQKSLEEDGDINQDLPNVKAIIAAYRSQQLTWNEKVTYWSDGNLVAGPHTSDMKEIHALSAKYGPKGFWVEGLGDYKPASMNLWFTAALSHTKMALHKINITLRNPATQETNTMQMTIAQDFIFDTGADSMMVFEQDITELEQLSGQPVPHIGSSLCTSASGQFTVHAAVLQAMIFVQGQPLLPHWVDIRVITNPGATHRLSGVWILHMLFMLSMPDSTRGLHIGTNIGEMLANLRIPDYRNAVPPPILR